MKFRSRVWAALLMGALVPLVVLALVVRHEMTSRLVAQYERRVDGRADVIASDLQREREAIRAALSQVREAAAVDNRFRRAAVDGVESERRYLLDYASGAMRLAGLSMLQIQDQAGRIVSSGHFRNDYDRVQRWLPERLALAPDASALVRVRTPGDSLLVYARVDSFDVGSRRFILVGGIEAESGVLHRLTRDDAVRVSLILPSDSAGVDTASGGVAASGDVVKELSVPIIEADRSEPAFAIIRVSHDLAELRALRRSVDRWFLIVVAAAALLAVALAEWMSSAISRPVVELAEKAARVDLDRLDVEFDSARADEVGELARGLDAMTARLRDGATLLKDAERRATVGELARQVNHDLRNGLTPIRNVLRHLGEEAERDPSRLAGVFAERKGSLDASIEYLDQLASSYARLSRRGERARCDLNDVVRRVSAGVQGVAGVDLRADLCQNAFVLADPISLRRIVENLVDNAIDSLEGRPGQVVVSTARVVGDAGDARVRLTVADNGVGMTDAQRARVFDDFYTTKPEGTGLGLSITRRLVMDIGGVVEVASEAGKGSRFVVDFPAAVTAAEVSEERAG